MKRIIQAVLLLSAVMFSNISSANVSADMFVKTIADDVITILKKDKELQSDPEKVYALAEDKILPNFNFDRVSRLVLGKNYTKATKEQQDAFQKEFRTLLIHTYASALSKYRNQVIEYKPLRDISDPSQVVVKTLILQPGGQPLGVDYSLEQAGDTWKVYDIVIEGVSLVTNYRGQFSAEIRQGGMDGLIQRISEKNKSNHIAKK
jgi:phospholipid transport system substrate-binding protein